MFAPFTKVLSTLAQISRIPLKLALWCTKNAA